MLDLVRGDGSLLAYLMRERNVRGYGIKIAAEGVLGALHGNRCSRETGTATTSVHRGVPVVHDPLQSTASPRGAGRALCVERGFTMVMRERVVSWWQRQIVAKSATLLFAVVVLAGCASFPGTDPLPSWNDGPTKAAIVKLMTDTTRSGGPGFVPVAERIATFDNDGTLWTEHPFDNDREAIAKLPEADFFKLIAATHVGQTSAQFQKAAADWLAVTKDPRFNKLHTELVYQPMLEVLAYFRANGYKTYIVSGGTVDFMRSFTDKAYGIPPEQVIGTSFDAKYTFTNDVAAVTAEPRLMLLDDGPGKGIGIDHFIGRVPIAAFGNSDGDIAMLQTTTNSPTSKQRPRLAAFVWHTDAVREYAYDRNTTVRRLNQGLDLAPRLGWRLIDMKNDWKVIYPFELK